MKTVTVTVTAEDIQNGVARASKACPVVLAAKRIGEDWTVGANEVCRIKNGGCVGHVRMPPAAHRFINAFDAGVSVVPFRFDVELWDV